MTDDDEILQEIRSAFECVERPEHFTDYTHCEECAEHDETLRNRNVDTLSHEDVRHIGYDPICFCTPKAFAYYLPALARIACAEQDNGEWFGLQFFWHLSYPERVEICSEPQRRAVVRLLQHIQSTKSHLIERHCIQNDIGKAMAEWGKPHDSGASPVAGASGPRGGSPALFS